MSQYDLLKIISNHPGITAAELINLIDINRSNTSKGLKKLSDHGLIEKKKVLKASRAGRQWVHTHYITPRGKAWL